MTLYPAVKFKSVLLFLQLPIAIGRYSLSQLHIYLCILHSCAPMPRTAQNKYIINMYTSVHILTYIIYKTTTGAHLQCIKGQHAVGCLLPIARHSVFHFHMKIKTNTNLILSFEHKTLLWHCRRQDSGGNIFKGPGENIM